MTGDLHTIERGVIGVCTLQGALVEPLSTEVGLRPDHFFLPECQRAFAGLLALVDAGRPVDQATLLDQLRQGTDADEHRRLAAALELAFVELPVGSSASAWARIVVTEARWRKRQATLQAALTAAAQRDETAYTAAEASLRDDVELGDIDDGYRSPLAAATEFSDWLESEEPDDVVPTPWPKLNGFLAGGLRPGSTWLLSAWTSIGKSIAVDQILEHASGRLGADRVQLWINEMSRLERYQRYAARTTSASFTRIARKNLSDAQVTELNGRMNAWPWAIQHCPGWPIERICRDLRRRRPAVAALDLFTQVPNTQKVEDIDRAIGMLVDTAQQVGCVLIVVHQLNQGRNTGAAREDPALRDLRGSGQMQASPAGVLLLHRPDEERSEGMWAPGDTGYIRIAKARNAELGMVPLDFDGPHQRFLEA